MKIEAGRSYLADFDLNEHLIEIRVDYISEAGNYLITPFVAPTQYFKNWYTFHQIYAAVVEELPDNFRKAAEIGTICPEGWVCSNLDGRPIRLQTDPEWFVRHYHPSLQVKKGIIKLP
jgi:hypothetical protein